jgi:peptidoglycan/xylan/chitin deacetylase (PgdA/CDA1 family)
VNLGGTPVFLYHGITSREGRNGSARERKFRISEAAFREQIQAIRTSARRVASLRELVGTGANGSNRGSNLKNVAVITFDDGLASDYEIAFPMLAAERIAAEFFINPAYVGTAGFLTWAQIAEMQRSGMSFQSHGYEHVDLARLSIEEMERQMMLSKQIIENKCGKAVDFISAPYGRASRQMIRMAMKCGYSKVCTSRNWPARQGGMVVNRVAIYSKTTVLAFERLLAGNAFDYAARNVRAAMLFLPKAAAARLGWPRKGSSMLESVL